MKRVSVWDLDGTVICSLHRYKTINGKIDLAHWRANQHLAGLDSLLPLAKTYQEDLQDPDCYVVAATARVMNEPDFTFVRDVLGQPDHIISRPAHETRSGAVLKVAGLNKLLSLKQFATAKKNMVYYEDNVQYLKAVCDFFKCRGVYCPSEQGH